MENKTSFSISLIAPCGMNCGLCIAHLRDKKICQGCNGANRLQQLDRRYKTNYSMSMIENLEKIKQSGMDDFIRSEIEIWTCKDCGGVICVHRGHCLDCK